MMTCSQPTQWTPHYNQITFSATTEHYPPPQASTEQGDDILTRFLLQLDGQLDGRLDGQLDGAVTTTSMEIDNTILDDDSLPSMLSAEDDVLQDIFTPSTLVTFDIFNIPFPNNVIAIPPPETLPKASEVLVNPHQQQPLNEERCIPSFSLHSNNGSTQTAKQQLDTKIIELAPNFRDRYFVELMTRYCQQSSDDVASIIEEITVVNGGLNLRDFDDILELYGGLGSPDSWVHSYALYVIYNNLETKSEFTKKWDHHKSATRVGVTFDTWRSRMSSIDKIIVGTGRQKGMGHAILGILEVKDLNPMRHAVTDDISAFLDMWANVQISGLSLPLQTINADVERFVERIVNGVTQPAPIKLSAKGKPLNASTDRPRLTLGVTKQARTLPWPNKIREDLGSDSESDTDNDPLPLSADGSRFHLLLTRKTTRHVTFTPRIQSMLERFEKVYNAETKRFIPAVMKEFKAVLDVDDEESRWMLLQLACLTARRNDLREIRRLDPRLYRICKNVDALTMGTWGACFDAVCLPEMMVMREYLETSNEIWKMKLDTERDYPQVQHDLNYREWRLVFERVVYALF